jgi:hypothetical protein
MDLFLYLESGDLTDIQLELLKAQQQKDSKAHHLNNVGFFELCQVILRKILVKDELTKKYTTDELLRSVEYISTIRQVIQYFECVDVDSRGVISFTDFTNFCLRVGREKFKSSIKRAIPNYVINSSKTAFYPTFKFFFANHEQVLYSFDLDAPFIRYFR